MIQPNCSIGVRFSLISILFTPIICGLLSTPGEAFRFHVNVISGYRMHVLLAEEKG